MMSARAFSFRCLVLTLVMVVAGCQTTAPQRPSIKQETPPTIAKEMRPVESPKQNAQKRKVGVLLPLSGAHAAVGKSLRNAIELSLFDNADPTTDLVFKDTQGAVDGAVVATRAALNEKVDVILGPLFGVEAQAVGPLARARHVPVLCFSNDTKVAGQSVYALGFSPQEQVRTVMMFARQNQIQRIVALLPATPYGAVVKSELQRLFKEGVINLVGVVTYTGNQAVLAADLARLKDLAYDGLFMPVGGGDLHTLFGNLDRAHFDYRKTRLLGSALWDNPETYALPMVSGGWFAAPDPQDRRAFEDAYRQAYGTAPKRICSVAYDGMSLVAALPQMDGALTNDRGFMGVDGAFRLKPSGVTERNLAILEVGSGQARVIQPAPQGF